jgi:hypothetical protein
MTAPDHDRRDHPGSLVFLHALTLATDRASVDEGGAELIGLAARRRAPLEAARARWRVLLNERPEDSNALDALTYLDEALRRGARNGWWAGVALVGPSRAAT